MTGWHNHPLHPEPITDKCGSVEVAPVISAVLDDWQEPFVMALISFPADPAGPGDDVAEWSAELQYLSSDTHNTETT